MIYLHLFETESGFTEERSNNYEEPWISYTEETDRVDYNDPYLSKPFTVKALGAGEISWSLNDKTLSYSKNNGTWGTMTSATTIQVVGGDEIKFKGTNTDYSGNTFASTAQFSAEGNIMSLLYEDNFKTANSLNGVTDVFYSLFKDCTTIVSASNLKLPATELSTRCYYSMFQGCTNLVDAPQLPAKTVAFASYGSMFKNCSSLLVAPKLPATTLAESCYSSTFTECISLTKAPELPAETLASKCYSHMFHGCTGLTETMSILPAKTLKTSCYEYMFNSCSNIETAPVLPAISLTSKCYQYMFSSCVKLNWVKAMFTTTPGTYTTGWVTNVASTGTFVKNSSATWATTGNNGVPSGWTVQRETPSE